MLEGTQEGVQGGDCKIAAEGGDEGGGGEGKRGSCIVQALYGDPLEGRARRCV